MESPKKSIAHAWDIWVGLLLASAGPMLGWLVLRGVPLEFLILMAGVWLATIGICWRRPLLVLVGPLFLYEIIRETRRSRYFLLRIYCYLILVILIVAALIWSATGTSLILTVAEGTRIAQTIAVLLLFAHLLLVTLIAPVYVGGAVADEKEGKTLEFLMATELGSNEILLGKLGVRLAIMSLMLLTGLPVLALLQLVGGLDADLVLGGFAATLAYTFSLACLALFNSVRARRARDAIISTYLMLVGFLIGSWLFSGILSAIREWLVPSRGFFGPGSPIQSAPAPWILNLLDYLGLLGAGNPFLVDGLFATQVNAGKTVSQGFTIVFLAFIGFHVIVGLMLIALAMLSFRKVFKLEQEVVRPKPIDAARGKSRDVGNHPLLWKELWIDGTSKPGWLRMLMTGVIVLGSFVPAWQLSMNGRSAPRAPRAFVKGMVSEVEDSAKQLRLEMEREYANWAFSVSTIILSLFLLQIAVHASSKFSRERERHTLDNLLGCPVTPAELLAAKWGGAMLSIRLGWFWLATVWLIGATLGNVPLLAFGYLLILWLIYAAAIACLGLWYSMTSPSSTRSLIYTIATLAILFTGIIALPMQSRNGSISPSSAHAFRDWLFRFQISMSPAFVFDRLIPSFAAQEVIGSLTPAAWEGPMIVICASCWLAVGAICCWRTWFLLRRQMYPERDESEAILEEVPVHGTASK